MKKLLKRIIAFSLTIALVIPTMQNFYAAEGSSDAGNTLLKTVYMSTGGVDSNDGSSKEKAVRTFNKALSLVSDGGAIQTDETISLNQDLTLTKSITLINTKSNTQTLILGANKTLSVEKGHILTFKPATAAPQTLFLRTSSTLSDGSYKFDYSGLSADDQVKSYALFFDRGSKAKGNSKDAINIEVKQGELLKTAGNSGMSITNANISHTTPNKSGAYGGGGSADMNLIQTTYNVSNTAKNTNLAYHKVFKMENSVMNIDFKELPNTYHAIQFFNVPEIKNSTINLKQYGSLLFEKNSAVIENSTLNTDGLFDVSRKPEQVYKAGDFGSTALFRSDVEIKRFSVSDASGNKYEYGLPYKHSENAVVKEIPLPKADLKFQNEDGSKKVTIPIIKGSSFAELENKVFANGTKISKSLLSSIYNMEKIPADKEVKMLINGDETKPYNFTDVLNSDQTVTIKVVDRDTKGVRYYLNDGSKENDHYYFVEGEDAGNKLMSFEEIIGRDNIFSLRGKKFLGWSASSDSKDFINSIAADGIKNVYAQWEDKKAFHVTYYRQNPKLGGKNDTYKIEQTLYEGEHIAGILADPSNQSKIVQPHEIPSYWATEASPSGLFYPMDFFGEKPNTITSWTSHTPNTLDLIWGNDYRYRTQGWNTAPDGSGTYYRGGQELTAEIYEKTGGNLNLYDQWVTLEWLGTVAANNIANPDLARPNITLAGQDSEPGNYETAANALIIDHSQPLNYRATLDFSKIRKDLVTLWGRIDQVTQWYGEMNAYFDARLDFDKDIKVLFESTWQIPDKSKLADYGVKDLKQVEGNPNQWIFTISKEQAMKTKVTGRVGTDKDYDSSKYEYYKVSIPVTILPKYSSDGHDFQSLSFEDFMKPMTLTVIDNFNRGLNAYVSRNSLNSIALGDKPIIIVGGDIEMHINGFERSGTPLLNYTLKSPAYDEHAKAYPTGLVLSSYEIVENDNYKKVITPFENPETEKYIDEKEGRAANENVENDPNNYSEKYSVGIPKAPLHDNKMNDLVAIKIQVQKVGIDGVPETNEDGSPKIEEKIYADRYYDKADGLAGSLEEGRSLLSGEFNHGEIIHYILQYAAPKLDVQVTKKWIGARKDSVKVELYADGEASGNTLTLTAEKEWKDAFKNLFRYNQTDGHEIKYSVKEVGTDENYTVNVSGDAEKGFTLTNTNVRKRDISVTKKWIGPSKVSAKVELYMDDEASGNTLTLTADNNWKGEFKDLLCYDKKDGHEIKYSVKEVGEDENYVVKISGDAEKGFEVTNTNISKRDVYVIKTWIGPGKDSVKVELYIDGKASGKTLTLSTDREWKGEFKGLLRYDEKDGHEIVYTIKEENTDGKYESNITGNVDSGFVITNTNQEKINVSVEKKWIGAAGKQATVSLIADGVETNQRLTLTQLDAWKGIFKTLNKYDSKDGHEIVYSVREENIDGKYKSNVAGSAKDGFVVTNTNQEKISIPVVKQWVGSAKDKAEVTLYADDKETNQRLSLTAANGWNDKFTDLFKYDQTDGHEIVYTVKEKEIDGYIAGISGTAVTGFTITNTITGKVSIPVTKKWIGAEADKVIVHLYADGKEVASKELTKADKWQYTFTNLEKYEKGNEISYTIKEEPLNGYDSQINGDMNKGFIITNTNTSKKDIPVAKEWIGPSKDSVKVELYADGEASGKTLTLTADNDWKDTFKDLLRYDQKDGHEIKYSVKEADSDKNYVVNISGDTEKGFIITNTITGKRDISVKKIWVGKEESQATVHLFADGKEVASHTLVASENWMYIFKDLNRYEKGKEIVYSITEDSVENYQTKVDGDADNGFVVTNTKERDKTNKPPVPPKPGNPNTPAGSNKSGKITKAVKTSDPENVIIYFGLFSYSVITISLLRQQKKRKLKK